MMPMNGMMQGNVAGQRMGGQPYSGMPNGGGMPPTMQALPQQQPMGGVMPMQGGINNDLQMGRTPMQLNQPPMGGQMPQQQPMMGQGMPAQPMMGGSMPLSPPNRQAVNNSVVWGQRNMMPMRAGY